MNQELEQAIVKYGNEIWQDGYGQGVYEEQERIIKLLEQNICQLNCPSHPGNCYPEINGLEKYVKLIIGEK